MSDGILFHRLGIAPSLSPGESKVDEPADPYDLEVGVSKLLVEVRSARCVVAILPGLTHRIQESDAT